jgi:hypothetical protein
LSFTHSLTLSLSLFLFLNWFFILFVDRLREAELHGFCWMQPLEEYLEVFNPEEDERKWKQLTPKEQRLQVYKVSIQIQFSFIHFFPIKMKEIQCYFVFFL